MAATPLASWRSWVRTSPRTTEWSTESSARAPVCQARRGYLETYPAYVIYPDQVAVRGGVVAVLGHTTGSNLGLPDDKESQLMLVWVAEVIDGAIHSWRLIEDTPDNRQPATCPREGMTTLGCVFVVILSIAVDPAAGAH